MRCCKCSFDTEAKELAWGVFQGLDELDSEKRGAQADPFDPDGVCYLRFDDAALEQFYDWMRFNENRIRSGTEHPALESHFAKYRSMVPSITVFIK